jgi:hypothetical protein
MTMKLIARERASHWYLRNGEPFHVVGRADGPGERPVTLRDARKVRALPSVTNILGIIAKVGLDAWKLEQAILAALTLPRVAAEPLDVYARRVVTDMDAQVNAAAELGRRVHGACEAYARAGTVPEDPELAALWQPWREWFDANVIETRRVEAVVVSHEHGYGGTIDLECRLQGLGWAVVDFKTQRVKTDSRGNARANLYETWPLQLAAYRQTLEERGHELVSVVIDVARPRPVVVQVWERTPLHWENFAAAAALWRYVKGYDPRGPAECIIGGEPCRTAAA